MRLQVTVEDCYCDINLKAQPHSSILTFSEVYIPIFFIPELLYSDRLNSL